MQVKEIYIVNEIENIYDDSIYDDSTDVIVTLDDGFEYVTNTTKLALLNEGGK